MLTKLLMRDEMTASLGKTDNNYIVHVLGEGFNLHERKRQSITEEVNECNSRESMVLHLLVQLVGV